MISWLCSQLSTREASTSRDCSDTVPECSVLRTTRLLPAVSTDPRGTSHRAGAAHGLSGCKAHARERNGLCSRVGKLHCCRALPPQQCAPRSG